MYASGQTVRKYRLLSLALAGMLVLIVISKAYLLLKLAMFSPFAGYTLLLIAAGLVVILLFSLLIYYVIKGHARAYKVAIVLSIFGIGDAIKNFFVYGLWAVVDIIAVIIRKFILRKIFLFKPIKKPSFRRTFSPW